MGREPVGRYNTSSGLGGNAAFGVLKYTTSGDLSVLAPVSSGSIYSLAIGINSAIMVTSVDIIAWAQAIKVDITDVGSYTGALLFCAYLRDATKLPGTPTAAQLFAATALFSVTVNAAVGAHYGINLPVNTNTFVPGNTDSYGNTIEDGDTVVFDLALTGSLPLDGMVGTWAVKLWFTVMV